MRVSKPTASEHNVPYLGICLGMQVAVIEFARSIAEIADANSSEFDRGCADPVIALITEWQTETGETVVRSSDSDLGGTMRLGFEFNDNYANRLIEAGLVISARSNDSQGLVEMVELPEHPWFVGCQFHPEYTSNPRDGHPLFTSFVNAALAHRATQQSAPTPVTPSTV